MSEGTVCGGTARKAAKGGMCGSEIHLWLVAGSSWCCCDGNRLGTYVWMSRGGGDGLFCGESLRAFLHIHTTVFIHRALPGIVAQLT